jgi:hypothetical protein
VLVWLIAKILVAYKNLANYSHVFSQLLSSFWQPWDQEISNQYFG